MREKSFSAGKEARYSGKGNFPAVGEPLDGRHFLDVIEEQQYTGKPFVKTEQNEALGKEPEKKGRSFASKS